jgi:hypothetical protein
MCPSTLQEAKPKAGSVRGRGDHETDRRRESKPRSRSRIVRTIDRSFGSTVKRVSNRAADHPDENKSGRGWIGTNGTWARSRRNARSPGCGIKPAKGTNPRSAAGRGNVRGKDRSSGKAARLPRDAGSGTPREEDASAHDPPGRRDQGGVAIEQLDRRVRRERAGKT